MYVNYILLFLFIFIGKGFFSWDEEFLIALGLFLVIYFLFNLLKTSLFNSLIEQIDKIALKFMFFYSLNIIMLKILINSFKREFELKSSISYVYLYLSSYTADFSSINKVYLVSVYKNTMNQLLSKLLLSNFEVNKHFYISSSNDLSDLNKFIFSLEKVLLNKTF